MTKYILWMMLCLVIVFFVIILVRAILFLPKKTWIPEGKPIEVNKEKAVRDLQEMIRCKTVSSDDTDKMDLAEFEKFQNLLPVLYPNIHMACERRLLGKNGILYHWKGEKNDKPIVLMAHYDVVPVEEKQWEKPAFAGILEDGFIWGRGTLDTKGSLCGILEAAEMLIAEGFLPKQDMYFAFSGEEEINGSTCPAIVDWFEQQNIHPEMVLDEGGAVVENAFPGVKDECALIGIAEKGYANIKLQEESRGGHASMPPVHTIVGELAEAVVRIEKHPFSGQLTKPVKEMVDTLGRHSTFGYKILFANLWCFKGLFAKVCQLSGGELNAMMRTTCAVTRMEGSHAFNVLPPKASVGMNLRLMGSDTVESARKYLENIIKNPSIKVTVCNGRNPSPESNIDCDAWKVLCQTIADTWTKALVSPYLMMACSDSWHYNRITDRVYKFSAMKLSKEERAMVHGNNERIPVDTLVKTVEFYVRLMKKI
ncbi:MAG: M20/M25/M40 family metallo-hydrolase [Lachnospiraceae bacterium]|nr:M20/M25/M40 family metallo-hydrolase [Lachnospiraceae bacterium]